MLNAVKHEMNSGSGMVFSKLSVLAFSGSYRPFVAESNSSLSEAEIVRYQMAKNVEVKCNDISGYLPILINKQCKQCTIPKKLFLRLG